MPETNWPKLQAEMAATLAEDVRLRIMTREEADAILQQVRDAAEKDRPRQLLRSRWRAADALEAADPKKNGDLAAKIRREIMDEAKALGIPDGIP